MTKKEQKAIAALMSAGIRLKKMNDGIGAALATVGESLEVVALMAVASDPDALVMAPVEVGEEVQPFINELQGKLKEMTEMHANAADFANGLLVKVDNLTRERNRAHRATESQGHKRQAAERECDRLRNELNDARNVVCRLGHGLREVGFTCTDDQAVEAALSLAKAVMWAKDNGGKLIIIDSENLKGMHELGLGAVQLERKRG